MKDKGKNNLKVVAYCMMLLMMAFGLAACNGTGKNPESNQQGETSSSQNEDGAQVLGEGSKVFDFAVVDKDGNETDFEIHTDEETVGEALIALGVIEGEEGPYGLYVKKVNGISADFDADGVYWAFYINGEYAVSGVELTPIKEGENYMFKIEK